MRTILGSGSAAGTELAKQLINYTNNIRLVSRNPPKINETDQLIKADLSDLATLDEAVKGSEIVYVTIAFEYKASAWKVKWPRFMSRLIELCKKHNAWIVFIDNIYMYDPKYLSDMTEDTPINPISEKGKVRAAIFYKLMNAVERGDVKAVVARSADFYGPEVTGSYLTQSVYNNLIKDKNPQWLGKLDAIHSFTYSKDIGKSLALLGNSPDAYNQVWHLPTTDKKLTPRKWTELMMNAMNNPKKINSFSTWELGLLGIFIPVLKELKEMSYQLNRDYFFNSGKFNKRFNFTAKSPEESVKKFAKS